MNWRRAGILLFAWTLTGCATPRPPVQTDAFWSGRLALQVQSEPPQQWFANFELQGTAEQAEIRTSSGNDRLDKAALDTVQRWRYVPGKRHGNPEAMWFNVPVRFVLE